MAPPHNISPSDICNLVCKEYYNLDASGTVARSP